MCVSLGAAPTLGVGIISLLMDEDGVWSMPLAGGGSATSSEGCLVVADGCGRLELSWERVLGADVLELEPGAGSSGCFASCWGRSPRATALAAIPAVRIWCVSTAAAVGADGGELRDETLQLVLLTPLAPAGEDDGAAADALAVRVRAAASLQHGPRRLLLVINPHAGRASQTARALQRLVLPVFAAAGIAVDSVTTASSGAGVALGAALDLAVYEGVVIAGGDGTAHEVAEGLLARADWAAAVRRTALCMLPGGSTHALATGLRTHRWLHAVICVVKRRTRPLDSLLVTNGRGLRGCALAVAAYGLAARVAMQGEATRLLLGTHRYTFLKAAGLLAALAAGHAPHGARVDWSAAPVPSAAELAVGGRLVAGFGGLVNYTKDTEWVVAHHGVEEVESESPEAVRAAAARLCRALRGGELLAAAAPALPPPPPPPSAGDSPLPPALDGAEVGTFLSVAVINLASEAPHARASGGAAQLMLVRGGSRTELCRALCAWATSRLHRSSAVTYMRVRSVVIEPLSRRGGDDELLCVDGEAFPGPPPYRIAVVPALFTVFGERQ